MRLVLGEPAVGTVFVRGGRPASYEALQLFVGVLVEVLVDEVVAVDDQAEELAATMNLGHLRRLLHLTVVTATVQKVIVIISFSSNTRRHA